MEQNKTICFFNSHKVWGGGEKWHYDAALYFKKQGYNVIVVGCKNGELLNRLPNDIEKIGIKLTNHSFLNPLVFLKVYKILKDRNIQSIIFCLPIDMKIGGIVAKWCKIPNRIYGRGSAIPIRNSFTNRFLFKHVLTGVIANSQATKRTILQNNPNLINPDKISVNYLGIEVPECVPAGGKEPFTIGIACRLEPQKNLFSLVEIAEKLKAHNKNFVVKIAGDGSLFDILKNMIAEKNLQENVQLVGFQNNTWEFYQSLDCFVLTSHWEGFGYVLAEAMVHYLPLVVYDVSSNPELVKDGYNGFLVQKDNVEDFSQRVLQLIENKELREEMGRNARSFVEQNFEINYTFSKVEQYIRGL